MMKRLVMICIPLAMLVMAGGGLYKLYRTATAPATAAEVPTTTVKRGDVIFEVPARGQIQGGNSELLRAPMTGGSEMVITSIRSPGELVQSGDIVVQFDTTQQEYELSEAEADVAEAEQQLIQARANNAATEEESRYALLSAQAQVALAELEVRKNPLIAPITARQNELALEAARDRLRQLREDLGNQQATSKAALAIQEAAMAKAKARGDTARHNIESMTLRAASGGYVEVLPNMTQSTALFIGMQLPEYQLGDSTRAGVPIAQIPDLETWQVVAQLSELDRGHVDVGQDVAITVIAVPEKEFHGKVQSIGGTTGPTWNRQAMCMMTLDNPSPELRQGMSARIVIKTGSVRDALWIPSQALFESDSRTFVYRRTPSGFVPTDVELVRRGDTQAVIRGVQESDVVALASPEQSGEQKASPSGVMEALPGT